MGIKQSSIKNVNFEDIKNCKKNGYILINTLSKNNQECLISNTVSIDDEEVTVQKAIKEDSIIIIYGLNNGDPTIYKKYDQIMSLGHKNVYLYLGGLFEWLLLQDIYGTEMFQTTNLILDHLKYKPASNLNILLLKN